jgi:hypothetical protein
LVLFNICISCAASQAQSKLSTVPKNSNLRGVVVEDLTPDKLKWTGAGHGSLPEVVITSLEQRSPAAAAGLQNGDVIADVYVTGPADTSGQIDPHITASEFYRKAALCTADCLVLVESRKEPTKPAGGPPDSAFKAKGIDVLAVGCLGTNFVLKYFEHVGYLYESLETGHIIAANHEIRARDVNLPGQMREIMMGDDLDWRRNAAEPVDDSAKIRQEIDKIRSSPHETMPSAQATGMAVGGGTSITVENATEYLLSIFISGPVTKKVDIAARTSETISLAPGDYDVAARGSDPSVVPFFGRQNYAANTGYSERFYLSTSVH